MESAGFPLPRFSRSKHSPRFAYCGHKASGRPLGFAIQAWRNTADRWPPLWTVCESVSRRDTPQGFNYQTGFRLDPFPTFTYDVEGTSI